MHCHWRDSQAWHKAGLPMTTPSNEAAKMYDAVVTQYVGFYNDDTVDGLSGACKTMMEADPEFVLGQVINTCFGVMSTDWKTKQTREYIDKIESIEKLCDKQQVNERERKHVNAAKVWAEGYPSKACEVYEDILIDHPTDMLALKLAYDCYFTLGYQPQLRDLVTRVMPYWKPDIPLYSYLYGMKAFGLVETNFYDKAEKNAMKGIEMNPLDVWAVHTMGHVNEMKCQSKQGAVFLSETSSDWKNSTLACHVYWHLALCHLENGEYDKVLELYDTELKPRLRKGKAIWMVTDASSLLLRLEMAGVDVGNRWNIVFDVASPHTNDHAWCFGDVHMFATCLRANQKDTVDKMMESMKEYIQKCSGDNHEVTESIGVPVCEAFSAYNDGDFAKAVDLILPVRYSLVKLGGSDAQRDLFSLFLINAALNSSKTEHQKLARQLLLERKALRENSPMTDKMMGRLLATHSD